MNWLKIVVASLMRHIEKLNKNKVDRSEIVNPDWSVNDTKDPRYIAGRTHYARSAEAVANGAAPYVTLPREYLDIGEEQEKIAIAERKILQLEQSAVRYTQGYNLTLDQQRQARENIGAEKAGRYDAYSAGTFQSGGGQANYTGAFCHGSYNYANKMYSTAFGYFVQANGECQFALGRANIIDTDGKYIFIIGNGADSSGTERSNAHTVDWDGNGWFAGTVEGTGVIVKSSTEGSTKRFKLTVDDSGTVTATEVVETTD